MNLCGAVSDGETEDSCSVVNLEELKTGVVSSTEYSDSGSGVDSGDCNLTDKKSPNRLLEERCAGDHIESFSKYSDSSV